MEFNLFVINGYATSGKDTFIREVRKVVESKQEKSFVGSYSSVRPIKDIARNCLGWDGKTKDEKTRKLLSELKRITTEYNDFCYKEIQSHIDIFKELCEEDKMEKNVLFIHVRESEEIKRLVEDFGVKTVLVKRDSVTPIKSNDSDKDVMNFENYEYVIDNNGTLDDLKAEAIKFVESVFGEVEEC